MPLVSFSVACLSCLSFFSPLCRLTAHSLPSSWLRHGWPFLFLLYTSCYKERRIKKRTRTLRTIQKQERRMVRIGRTSPLPSQTLVLPISFYPSVFFSHSTENWHSNCLFREWLDSFVRDMYLCIPLPPPSVHWNHASFAGSTDSPKCSRLSHTYTAATRIFSSPTHFSLPSFFLAPCTDIFVRYWGACDYTRW